MREPAVISGAARCVAVAVALGLLASGAVARNRPGTAVPALVRDAAQVFHGRCTSLRTGVAEVGGVRLPATTYTFRVAEHLKGRGPRRVRFRQLGTPEGGPRDLGRQVGLPVYQPGADYVLFLLPPGPTGLTSPAGAAEGAFVVRGGRVARLGGAAPTPGAQARASVPGDPASYEELRRAVLAAVTP